MPIFLSLTPTLAAAVTPLNYARYQFIYPEDPSLWYDTTQISGTTVQGEIAYDLISHCYSGRNQINQIADASGQLCLTAFGHDTYALANFCFQD